MSNLDKTQWKDTYILKTKEEHYSTFSADKVISKIKQELVEKRIPCSVHVGSPRLIT